jgi:hypothetical protein
VKVCGKKEGGFGRFDVRQKCKDSENLAFKNLEGLKNCCFVGKNAEKNHHMQKKSQNAVIFRNLSKTH